MQPQAMPSYAPQFPTYPPQAPPAPQPAYPPQYAQPTQFPGYPPQGFPQQPTAPVQPLEKVSLDDFYNAPAVGTPSWSWKDKPLGTVYVGLVARVLTPSDVTQNTDLNGKPLFFRDGTPQPIMRVPMRVQPSTDFPNGEATWIVSVRHRDELARAMAEAGAPDGPPEPGAAIQVTLTERRPNRSGNPSNIVRVAYARPNGAAPVAPPVAAAPPLPTTTPEGVAQAMAAQAAQIAAQQAAQAQLAPQLPTAAPVAAPPAPAVPQAPAAPAPPPEMSAAQQELLAKLSGQTG